MRMIFRAMSRTLQAAIAEVHAEAASAEDTDWPQILALYELLERTTLNPIVTLNRAVAVAKVRGPQACCAQWTAKSAPPSTTASTPSAHTYSKWPRPEATA
jgi:predicted RNA polymerase sigma factor